MVPSLRVICGTCGRDNPDHLVFCQECGQRLGPRVAPPTPPIGLSPPAAVSPHAVSPIAPPRMAPPTPSHGFGATAQLPAPGSAGTRPQAPDFRFSSRPPTPAEMAAAAEAGVATVVCTMCGHTNQRGLRFCVTCGNPLEGAAHPPAPSPPAPPPPPPSHAHASRHPRDITASGPAIAPPPTPPVVLASAPISPGRVVDLGAPAAPKAAMRTCARCRGQSDANAQFCKFCGAPLGESIASRPVTAPIAHPPVAAAHAPFAPTPPRTPPPPAPQPPPPPSLVHSAMPDTPAIDAQQYRAYQAMSASPSAPTPMRPNTAPMQAPPPSPYTPQPPHASPLAASVAAPSIASSLPMSQQPTGVMSPVVMPSPARGRLVIIARDGGEGPSFPLGDTTDIGRTEGHIIIAEDRYISPRHARVMRRGDHVVLRDLGSVNGIFLRIATSGAGAGSAQASHASMPPSPLTPMSASGTPALGHALGSAARFESGAPPIHAPEAEMRGEAGQTGQTAETGLRDQDLFLVGQQVLRFEVVNGAEEGFGTASQHGTLLFGTPAAPRYARVSQRTVEGVTRDVFYIRKVETVLGRESGDIVFTEDPFLSRRHAAIRVDVAGKRFTLADLGSSNGTFLQIREEVRLKDGDHFRVGQQLFRIDIEATALHGAASGASRA